MTLIEQLREFPMFYQQKGSAGWLKSYQFEPLCIEAAAELERLERELAAAQEQIANKTLIYNDDVSRAIWLGEEKNSVCPRCGELACVDPDSKACSDNCIMRYRRELSAAQERIAQLERELVAAKKDAQRYRWIRQQKHIDIAACWLVAAEVPAPSTPDELDAVVDAALKELGTDTAK